MATKGFTKVDNCILLDTNLSLEAKGLYAILKHLSAIPNFSIRRDYVKSISGYGETAFRRVWKELKDKGLLIEIKSRNKGRYEYTYTLETNAPSGTTTTVTAPEGEKKKPKHVDSDGNVSLDGQINIDDVIGTEQEEISEVNENIREVVKATGFNDSQAKELLGLTKDVNEVINGYRYAMSQKDVKNIFPYTKWAVKNIKCIFQSTKINEAPIKSTFNHFKQRTYDFKKLERALLYGEPYELPV